MDSQLPQNDQIPAATTPLFVPRPVAAALLIVLVLVLELYGIRWGLPSVRNVESFHPDEWTVVDAALRVNPLAGQVNPGFYNYGSLYIFALSFAFSLTGLHDASAALDPSHKALLYLTARIVTVLFSLGTVMVTWRLGARLFGERTGQLSGLLLAVTPLFVVYSHYAIVDVPAAFWMVAAVLAAAHVIKPNKKSSPLYGGHKRGHFPIPGWLFLSATAAGFAAGTKYNAGVAILVPLVALYWLFREKAQGQGVLRAGSPLVQKLNSWGDLLYQSVLLLAAAFVCFLIATPGFLTDRAQFIRDFSFEVWHVRTGHDFIFTQTAPAFLHHLIRSLPIGMGLPLFVTALAGVLFALLRRTRPDGLMGVVVLAYYLIIGMAQVKFMRYTIPLLPFLCIWAARLLIAALATTRRRKEDGSRLEPKWGRLAAVACLILPGLCALIKTVAYDRALAGPDVRLEALDWLQSHARPRSSIGMIRHPWFDDPPVIPYNSIRVTDDWVTAHNDRWQFPMVFTGWSAAELRRDPPDYFILNDWDIRYRLRLHHLHTLKGGSAPGGGNATEAGQQAWDLVTALGQYYNLAATFERPARLGPLVFSQIVPAPGRDIRADGDSLGRISWTPDDWLFPTPTIWIYQRKAVKPGRP